MTLASTVHYEQLGIGFFIMLVIIGVVALAVFGGPRRGGNGGL